MSWDTALFVVSLQFGRCQVLQSRKRIFFQRVFTFVILTFQ